MKKFFAAVLPALLLCSAQAADSLLPSNKAQPEYLPVDQAFELQPLERRGGKLRVEWRIANGYFLYRERLSFQAGTLGEPKLPVGEAHSDEIFGKTTVYRDDLVAEFAPAAAKGAVTLTVSYQGCADAGLCYPPQTRTLELAR